MKDPGSLLLVLFPSFILVFLFLFILFVVFTFILGVSQPSWKDLLLLSTQGISGSISLEA